MKNNRSSFYQVSIIDQLSLIRFITLVFIPPQELFVLCFTSNNPTLMSYYDPREEQRLSKNSSDSQQPLSWTFLFNNIHNNLKLSLRNKKTFSHCHTHSSTVLYVIWNNAKVRISLLNVVKEKEQRHLWSITAPILTVGQLGALN